MRPQVGTCVEYWNIFQCGVAQASTTFGGCPFLLKEHSMVDYIFQFASMNCEASVPVEARFPSCLGVPFYCLWGRWMVICVGPNRKYSRSGDQSELATV